MTWIPHPLSVADGVIGAEENTARRGRGAAPARRAGDRRDEGVLPEDVPRAEATVARALGTRPRGGR